MLSSSLPPTIRLATVCLLSASTVLILYSGGRSSVQLSADRDYAHRPNRQGGLESICLFCFRTVASGHSPEQLEQMELRHTCPGKIKGEGNPLKLQRNDGQ